MPRSSIVTQDGFNKAAQSKGDRMYNDEDYEAMLYYLYMMADGEVSRSELKLFDRICEDMSMSNDTKEDVVDRCNGIAPSSNDILSVIKTHKIDSGAGADFFGTLKTASALARIIWNLINLGYADGNYSENERKIVNHLISMWKIPAELFQEMINTADTMLALTGQIEWLTKNISDASDIDRKKQLLNSEIEKLLKDIQISIEELDM